MDNADKPTVKWKPAAERAVQLWKQRKFAFVPAEPSSPPSRTLSCTVPGYTGDMFRLRHAVTLARLGSYIEHFIDDYAAKAKCDPLKDFYVYNNVPSWAHPTLRSKKTASQIRPNKHLTKDELTKFQRAFFRFELYARVHAHLETCVYGYLYSLQMLICEEMEFEDNIKQRYLTSQTYPVRHLRINAWLAPYDRDVLLRAKLASGVKRVWDSVVGPHDVRCRLVYKDILQRVQSSDNDGGQGLMLGNHHRDFMCGVLNGDPQCTMRRCCNNQWAKVHRFRRSSRFTGAQHAERNIVRFDEGGIMSAGIKPNYSWNKWRNRQIKHMRDTIKPITQREAESVIATRRMCGWVFWNDSTLNQLHRYRMSDFKAIDFNGFLVEKDDGDSNAVH
ncbi:hypothetical protein PG994_008701 [Apiospora phragmitis]|uniref:Uncharacterized protein n=1 Tax=Apiospora phragmitis TaxID=2905665 RepID=A0ABR1UH93_9PEZI